MLAAVLMLLSSGCGWRNTRVARSVLPLGAWYLHCPEDELSVALVYDSRSQQRWVPLFGYSGHSERRYRVTGCGQTMTAACPDGLRCVPRWTPGPR